MIPSPVVTTGTQWLDVLIGGGFAANRLNLLVFDDTAWVRVLPKLISNARSVKDRLTVDDDDLLNGWSRLLLDDSLLSITPPSGYPLLALQFRKQKDRRRTDLFFSRCSLAEDPKLWSSFAERLRNRGTGTVVFCFRHNSTPPPISLRFASYLTVTFSNRAASVTKSAVNSKQGHWMCIPASV